ncbi:DUF6894 family protein [Methylobacterium nigriterrae]|uniref:DUF6894 family protein n=1 Tax=Methylobacterium nigriterrae TaxID=3127512 RepID=UPI0030137B56
MPRYFFDFHHGKWTHDRVGSEWATIEDAYREAKRLLPAIARDEVPDDGQQTIYTVLVKDEDGQPVYTATLTFSGLPLPP